MEPLSKGDLLFITAALYPELESSLLERMVAFNMKVECTAFFPPPARSRAPSSRVSFSFRFPKRLLLELRWAGKGAPGSSI